MVTYNLIITPSDPSKLKAIKARVGAELPVQIQDNSVVAEVEYGSEPGSEELKALKRTWADIMADMGVVSVQVEKSGLLDGWGARLLAAAGGGALGLVGAWGVTRAMR